MSTLFMVNVPHNCTESQLCDWVRARGFDVKSVRLIRDQVAGVSPSFAYVDVSDDTVASLAIDQLNGQTLGNRVVLVSEARLKGVIGGPAGFARTA